MTHKSNYDAAIKRFVERAVALERQKSEIMDDLKDLYVEVKADEINPACLKKIVKLAILDDDALEKKRLQAENVRIMADAVDLTNAVQGVLL